MSGGGKDLGCVRMCLFHAQLIVAVMKLHGSIVFILHDTTCYKTREDLKKNKTKTLLSTSSNCADKLFTSTLTGAASVLAVLLLLLGFLLYKYKQVGCSPQGLADYFETPELVSL